jgi:signal transduction histidine kinase
MSTTPLHQRLYLRIWLAVVGTIVVLTLLAGWLARMDAEHERAQRPGREIVVRDAAGQLVGQAPARPVRIPGQGLEFRVTTVDGQTLYIQLPRPGARPPGMNPPRPTRFPINLAWMLALVAVAVALGTYPIVRRLTQRLEAVQDGVRQWGDGNLALRLPEDGSDEVASLARGFNVAAHRVQELLQSHKSLLANASHELRSPLTRIRMGLELMGSQPGPEFRNEIARNIRELDQLIDEILLASRLDASETDMGTIEDVDLLGMAAEECARVDAHLEAPQDQDSLFVPGVGRLLRRVMRNLLENARRHAAGAPTLSLHAGPQSAVLTVRDQGPGVPPAYREKIFQPFFRLPGASESDGGVGLGLALVKSIVERHGGTVRCDSGPAGGACFVVTLPRRAGSSA